MANKSKEKENKVKSKKAATPVLPFWLSLAVIAVLTWFVFSPSLQNEFTNWDDPTYVNDNPLVVNSQVPVKEIFSIKNPVSLNYHPLTVLSLAWNYQNGKLNPYGYHLENVILHVLNTILVFFFVFLLTRRNLLMAGFVALFFGIHPMHVESVSWVSERKDVLYVFFFVAGLVTYLKYREAKGALWYALTLILFVLSCLSKGMAVVFPVILLLIDYLWNVKWDIKIVVEKIPFFLLSIGFGVVAFKIQSGGAIADLQTFTPFQRLMFASYGAVEYIVKLFVPANLSAFYPYPTLDKNGGIPVIFYLSPFILLAFAAVVYLFLRKERIIVFGLLFYIVSVALVLQFVSVGSAILADRYSYLSYIGLLLPLAWVLNKAWEGKDKVFTTLKYPLAGAAVVAALVLCTQTYARTQVWRNTQTLWTDVIAKHPDVQTAWKNLGNYYGQKNKPDSAMIYYRVLVKMNTKDAKIYSNLGNVYGLRGKADSALWAYSKSIEIDSTNTDAYVNRAITYCMGKRYDMALPDFQKALSMDHNLFSVYANRGFAYLATGKYQEAINDYNLYISIKPEDGSAYYYRGVAEKALSRMDAYNADVQQAKRLGFKVPE